MQFDNLCKDKLTLYTIEVYEEPIILIPRTQHPLDIITIQETKLKQKAKTPKIPHYTTIHTDREHKQGEGLITLIKDDITFTNLYIPKAINTYNTELQLIKIHIGKTKDITAANTYFPPRDTTSPHYNTVDTDIAYCIRPVTIIPDSILTGDVIAHSTLVLTHRQP